MSTHSKTVVLDAGHGGHDPGALGPKKPFPAERTKESERALDVVLRIKRLLVPYVRVILTRSTDEFLSLSDRPAIANAANADVFVSYHFNSGDSPNTAMSFEVFTTPGQNRSDALASTIISYHSLFCPWQKLRADESDGDLDKEANFTVIVNTQCPSCLVEGEFIHTVKGDVSINNTAHQELRARAVACGILQFLGIPHDLDSVPSPEGDPPPAPPNNSNNKLELVRLADQILAIANTL